MDREKVIQDILDRGTEDIFIRESLEKKLRSGKRLTIKLGFDPTSGNIHLGRAIPLRKLRQFQDLGHKIVFLVGDFTARIGDPSDKLEKRPILTKEAIKKNMRYYRPLIGKILNLRKTKFVYNNRWLSRLRFEEITTIAEAFSVNQLSNRRNFRERLDNGEEVSLREFLYPIMQGYDSVKIGADVEIGGFDQLFNLKAGRTVQKFYGKEEQEVLTTAMLEGTDGRKMSSSWGNVINIDDAPNDMFGKVMRLNDDLISKYFLLCTDVPEKCIKDYETEMQNGMNPRDVKLQLAKEIVTIYHGDKKADEAKKYFIQAFSKKEVPDTVETVSVEKGRRLGEVVVEYGVVQSLSEFKRKCNENAVKFISANDDEEQITDFTKKIEKEGTLRIGKKLLGITLQN